MLYDNFAMLTKRELLIRIVKLLKKDELITGLKYLPVEMRPRNKRPVRCCIHKDRYILKHKIISILGFEFFLLSTKLVVPVSNHNMPSQTFAGDVKAGLV